MSIPPPGEKKSTIGPRVSRRTFLKAGGTAVVTHGLLGAQPSAAEDVILGPDAVPLSLKVNGVIRRVSVEPRTTLLGVLRNRLELTGAKEVCDRGACGACTVLLDGEPVASCMMLAVDAEGRDITTVEGLGTPGALSPVQQAFVDKDALQCGYCTPGFVVASTALLRRNPDPDLEEIKEGLAGNICRCGTYQRIFEAVRAAAGRRGSGGGR